MSQYIDESTHLQLTNAVAELTGVINAMADRGSRLTWEESVKVRQAHVLRQVALMQLKRAGVTIETPRPMVENRAETVRRLIFVDSDVKTVAKAEQIAPRASQGP
ncbi:hypothetical protein UFOVP178_44 [uncultured Caudovirales phage]|uniref:Uncharacterized protein n=1 Tax=uncultured Caudovirales phage TaxID=2100421 RepID=A0A6J7WCQ3_9CAUD|nr:hypothetical protein UFOVP178_44 [uncultured Caudovirales phage]